MASIKLVTSAENTSAKDMTEEKAFGVERGLERGFFLLAKPERLDDSQQPITIASNTGCATTSFIRNITFDFLSVLMAPCTDRIKA